MTASGRHIKALVRAHAAGTRVASTPSRWRWLAGAARRGKTGSRDLKNLIDGHGAHPRGDPHTGYSAAWGTRRPGDRGVSGCPPFRHDANEAHERDLTRSPA